MHFDRVKDAGIYRLIIENVYQSFHADLIRRFTMTVIRLVSSAMVIPAICFLLLTVILAASYDVSSAQKTDSPPKINPGALRDESTPSINVEPKTKPKPIKRDPSVTFTVLPRQVTTKVGDTFTVHINVANVSEMYGWQVDLLFDNRTLECVSVSVPHDYVFSYAYTVGEPMIDYNSRVHQSSVDRSISIEADFTSHK
jgi:hypothetical protein